MTHKEDYKTLSALFYDLHVINI